MRPVYLGRVALFLASYLGGWDLASLPGYIGIFLGSLYRELAFGQSTGDDWDFVGSLYRQLGFGHCTRVEWYFSWLPMKETGLWPVYPGRLGFFVVAYIGNWDLASLPA